MNQKHILIIDDEAPMRYLLERQLCRAGYRVCTAPDGDAGLALAKGHPDLIVLDIMMPGLDGFAVYHCLKRSPETASIPVVFLSASITAENRRNAFNLGAADVLPKPLRADELTRAIAAVFQRMAEQPRAHGRVVGFLTVDGPGTAAAEAIRFSRDTALQSAGPVLLIDLEFPFGAVAPRLGLAPAPHVLDVFADFGDDVPRPTGMAVWEAAQPVQAGLRALPARGAASRPFSPERLLPALDDLVGAGYTVVLNLGNALSAFNLAIVHRADRIAAVGHGTSAVARFEELALTLQDEGLPADKWVPLLNRTSDWGSAVVKTTLFETNGDGRPTLVAHSLVAALG